MMPYLALITILFATTLCQLDAEETDARLLVQAARSQIGVTLRYDGSYQTLEYPQGDVPIESGVCTDVVIRALRKAWKWDLQKRVHEDMKAHFSAYPKNWNLKRPDKNIDHRRVPNLKTYFKRQAFQIPISSHAKDYQPGDIVSCIVPPHLPHIMIVSDKKTREGTPLVIHNIGLGTQEEDRLFDFKITGHYRLSSQ
ncbi:MAG: DUF1287 domain-containing protein [Verrucomicrobiales bacterium]|nr:DUF1287 domain-containing protein [Verrucomicrobiales bacterium]